MPQVSVIPRTYPEVLGFFKGAFTYAKSQDFFPEEIVQGESEWKFGADLGICFLSPKHFEWSDTMGKGPFVSLKQANWFHLAHGADEGTEVGDEGFGVRVAGWGSLTADSKPRIYWPVFAVPPLAT